MGRREAHRGAAKGRVSFKVVVKSDEERERLSKASDEILDVGYDVVVDESVNRFGWKGEPERYVKLTIRW